MGFGGLGLCSWWVVGRRVMLLWFVGMFGVFGVCVFVACVLVVFLVSVGLVASVWLVGWFVCIGCLLVGFVRSVNSVGIVFLLVWFRVCCGFWLFVCYLRRGLVWRSGVSGFGRWFGWYFVVLCYLF